MKVVRIILIVFLLIGMFFCLAAFVTENKFWCLLGSLDAVVVSICQLCLTRIEKNKDSK